MSISRSGGILMPVSALHSSYGIGTFGKAAYEFADYLKLCGAKLWQVLPLGPTSYGDSPYQSFSAFAGNPYFIDLDILKDDGLICDEDISKLKFSNKFVDYEAIYNTRFACLEKAFDKFNVNQPDFTKFCANNESWLPQYSFYMAVKNSFNQKSWSYWDRKTKTRDSAEVAAYKKKLHEKILFYKFLQYEFFKQWYKLKKYVNDKGIKIIGDIPIYVALDSADTYFNPQLFQFDENLNPTRVAGCPPDDFSATGQLWGNPLYEWKNHEKDGFKWWISRIEHSLKMYDIVRIDHFRGFESFYSIDASSNNAIRGKWVRGPGIRLFKAVKEQLGDVDIIAEDLGFLTDAVYKLLNKSGFCGMKVLQFAFDDKDSENKYLPHNYDKNCVVYTGTHDNTTTADYYENAKKSVKKYICEYLDCTDEDAVWSFIKLAYASTATLAVVPMADVLNLDKSARINTPSTLGGNWIWRIKKTDLKSANAKKLKKLSMLYGR